MAADTTTYALGIELALNSQPAFDTLDKFGKTMETIEQQVSSSANKALMNISNAVRVMESSLATSDDILNSMALQSTSVNKSYQESAFEIGEINTGLENVIQLLEQKSDLIEDEIKNNKKIAIHEKEELKTIEKTRGWWGYITKSIKEKNLLHGVENELVTKENDLLEKANALVEGRTAKEKEYSNTLSSVTTKISAIATALLAIDKSAEAFVTTNYRAYDSQSVLANSTRALAAEFGLTQEQAVTAYQAMANVATSKDEIEKLTKTVLASARITGVAVPELAEYTMKMKSVGFSSLQTEKSIMQMNEAMRRNKLSTNDVKNSMAANNATLYTMTKLLGGTPEATAGFTGTMLTLKGMAKQIGVGTESIDDFQKQISNPRTFMAFQALTNTTIKSSDDFKKALLVAGKELKKLDADTSDVGIAIFEDMAKAYGMTTESARAAIKVYDETSAAVGRSAVSADDMKAAFDETTGSLAGALEESTTLTFELAKLSASFSALYGVVGQFVADGLRDLVYYINAIVGYVGPAISSFNAWCVSIRDASPALQGTISFLRALIAAIVVIGGALVGVGAMIGAFVAGLGTLKVGASLAMNGVKLVGNALYGVSAAIGKSIVVVLTSLGTGLNNLGRSVAPVIVPLMQLGVALILMSVAIYIIVQAFASFCAIADMTWEKGLMFILIVGLIGLVLVGLSMLIQGPVIVGMALLAATFASIGIAAGGVGILIDAVGNVIRSFADSLKLLATVDPEALAGGFAALGKGLYKLSYESGGLMGAAALLALGGALAVMGPGLQMTASSGEDAAKALDKLAISIPAFKTACAGIGGTGEEFATGLRALGAAASKAAVPLDKAGDYMQTAADKFVYATTTLRKPSSELGEIASAMTASSLQIAEVADNLIYAGNNLYVGGQDIIAAGPLLTGAAKALKSAAIQLEPAGAAIAKSMNALYPAAVAVKTSGDYIQSGATGILEGGNNISMGADALIGAADTLGTASLTLLPAAQDMVDPAMLIATVGSYLGVGGLSLYAGSLNFRDGALLLVEAIDILEVGAGSFSFVISEIGSGSIMLITASYSLIAGAGLLKYGSGLMLDGVNMLSESIQILSLSSASLAVVSISLGYGMMFLSAVAESMEKIGLAISRAGTFMLTGANRLYSAIDVLNHIGLWLLISAPMISIAAALLESAAIILLRGGKALFSASELFLPASANIYIAMTWLSMAIGRYSGMIDQIKIIGSSMLQFANAIIIISSAPMKAFRVAAEEALAAIPALQGLAGGIEGIASKLESAAPKLVTPVKELADSFQALEEVLTSVATGSASAALPIIEAIGTAVESTADALDRSVSKLSAAIDDMKRFMPEMENWANNFNNVSAIFATASDKFVRPADALARVMDKLGATIAAFSEGIDISDKVMSIAGIMIHSAELFESAAERIQIAVNAKAIPAMRAAEQAGIAEAVRSQAVATVRVMKDEGGATFELSDEVEIANRTLGELIKLNESVSAMGNVGEGGPITEIVSLLQTFLPNLNRQTDGLTSNMNGWNK